jgi:hypothetical protein
MKTLRFTSCLFVLLLSLIALTLSSPAQAGGPGNCTLSGVTVCSIALNKGKLILARTQAQISTTATCTIPQGLTFDDIDSRVDVIITQNSSKQTVESSSHSVLTTCNGTAQTVQVNVGSTIGAPPFRAGPASAVAMITACFFDVNNNFQCTSMSIGPQVIIISG